jgi:predicted transposase/invertase (TIGR01784 family)
MKLKNKLPDLQNAFGALELYATDPEKQRQLEERLCSDENFAYEMAAKYELGIEEGIEKGKLENKLETALIMRKEGDSLDKILRITGLSEDQLKENGIL